ncbi:hypothetical protein FVEG_15507 [Fusarium verticillioides 7600]|uniref:Uncharacterized protein n=1 Tax=Gibberella moniliformis (strain M3125 / FGSC 7600) TaxID=334819 RepID=W7LWG6_GIBM7|nr:hypothetical protein FVEG_15507 [Fusarium verticillioides 7600]XP_018749086.1 hypothetical protein FVEG_15507 [Fusarium verticillioides 7600]XP_018749087.1 hypothetical protein FVEG_15507 [Fusarium verticillioides 7600]EWG42894.1 hypothetical protein FVEG_15507 [Fusarium verticillioides 7600]EWG42895.1 hypothetical protein FVEG_15507 [Fusarium verticillioides 7600]EWG42896.1 hypothetical protein FVEG_15507 [Fusarium verticillioides 7600]
MLAAGTSGRGSSLTTTDSTSGGGEKLFLPTLAIRATLEVNCVLTERREYKESPGRAHNRSPNSRWTIRMLTRGGRGREMSLEMMMDEIWYGVLLMQTSNGGSASGRSNLAKSPIMISNFCCSGLPWTLFVNSAPMRMSSSTALTALACSRMRVVRTPVPGPISRTVSVGLRFAFATIISAMPGFFRMCWPIFVLYLNMFLRSGLSYGPLRAPPRLLSDDFGIVFLTGGAPSDYLFSGL